jgi:glycosyltransferase involved in cell wall biosynthesis
MKVAHLTTVDVSLRFLVLAQLRAVRDAGGEAIGISAPGPWVDDLEREGIRHIALESSTRAPSLLSDASAARELYRVLRAERPAVLHTHNPKPGVYGRVIGRLAGIPIIVNTVHGVYAMPTDRWTKRGLVYSLEAGAARFSDAELVQNPEDLALMKRWHLTRRDARLLGNGVDLARFDPKRWTNADRATARAEFGIEDDRVVIGAVGRLVAEKGYPELFDAYATLDRNRFALVVVGGEDPDKPDALSDASIARARDLGVRFLGHRDDVDRLYCGMDVFVLASHREGFPRAAMEAAASGLPVVATDVRGCRQVVDDQITGFLVSVREPKALAHAICAFDDVDERYRLGTAGRRKAEREFDERLVVATVLETYRSVAVRKKIAWDLYV